MLISNNLYFASDRQLDRCVTSISQSLVAIRLKAASFQWKAREKAISFLGRAEGVTAIFGMVPQSVAGFSAVRQRGGSSGKKGDKGGERRGEGGRERHRSRKGRKKLS